MELVMVPCGLCQKTTFRPIKKLNGYTIAGCTACGFASVNPRPSEGAILKAYTRLSLDQELSFASAYASDAPVESYGSWTGRWVLKRLIQNGAGKSFLDIGAGQGWAVLEALRLNADAVGFEFGDDRSFGKDARLNGKIFHHEDKIMNSGRRFDVIYLSAVLEHVYRPVEFLKHWSRLLKPGGRFCTAAVPNLESIFIRLGWDGWDGNIPPHHLNYFTPATLRACIERAGGTVEEIYTMGAPVRVNPANMFRQKTFEEKHWGDRSENWGFDSSTPAATAGQTHPAMTATVNHLLRWTGTGANLYAVFTIK